MRNEFDIVVRPQNVNTQYGQEVWRYRELLGFLAWRNVVVRYKQTVVGLLWCVIRPIIMLLIFYAIFGILAKLPSVNETPYAIMVFSGLIPWLFFSSAIAESSNSLIDEASLISKVYFPRIVVPLASILSSYVDFLIMLTLMMPVMIVIGYVPPVHVLLVPFVAVLLLVPTVGIGLILSSLNATYRDFRHILPFILQLGIYVSPVVYATELVPASLKLIYYINPMAGIIDLFRWAIVDQELYFPGIILSSIVSISCLILGARYFVSMERTLADKV